MCLKWSHCRAVPNWYILPFEKWRFCFPVGLSNHIHISERCPLHFLNIILQGGCKPGRIRGFWGWNVSPSATIGNSPLPEKSLCAHLDLHSVLFLVGSGRRLRPSTCLQCTRWSLTRFEVSKREAKAVKLQICFPHNLFPPTQSSFWVITHLRAASLYLSSCQLLPWDHGWPFIQGSLKLSVRIEYLCGPCVNTARCFYFLMDMYGDSIILSKKNKAATKSLANSIERVTAHSYIWFLKKAFVLRWGASGPRLWTKTWFLWACNRTSHLSDLSKLRKWRSIRMAMWTWILDHQQNLNGNGKNKNSNEKIVTISYHNIQSVLDKVHGQNRVGAEEDSHSPL